MKIINTQDNSFKSEFDTILSRGKLDIINVSKVVSKIIEEVKTNGNKALFEHIKKFDKWTPKNSDDLFINVCEIENAYKKLDKNLKDSLQLAHDRIKAYHEKQLPKSWMNFEDNGTILGQKVTAVNRAGLYIPGGKAIYPSSLLMNAIAATVAGVKEIIICTPVTNNKPNELLLAACHLCGITKVMKVGGASAIAAMAYGTESLKKVNVITGPGNIFVATAKKMVFGEVNIDMIAGPSEIGIISDDTANIDYLAMDLLSQAEHDEMASSILITISEDTAIKTRKKVQENLKDLSRYKIASKSINNRGCIIVATSLDEAVDLMNEIAPEHLEIITKNPFEILPNIQNAGAIFLGENTPEPIGDYIAGPNHTLPTGGTAKFYSPLGVENFMKKSSIISFSKKAITKMGKDCILLANTEGLTAHAEAVNLRLKY